MKTKILKPGPLQVERISDGRRRLLRDLNLRLNDNRTLTIPAGTTTDYSSWPIWAATITALLSVILVLSVAPHWFAVVGILLTAVAAGPRWSRVDYAGVAHDRLFDEPYIQEERVSFWEANRIWWQIARSGSHKDAQAGPFWAAVGWLGLTLFSWPVWLRRRWQDRHPPE